MIILGVIFAVILTLGFIYKPNLDFTRYGDIVFWYNEKPTKSKARTYIVLYRKPQ